ncbi:MAG TPA: hypothetical protein VE153_21830 [Myxococcus sp.]|jgi:hypothetical protein|nr:hypothetical protein [Myxococcus sp.]
MASEAPKPPSSTSVSVSLAIEANVKSNYVECVTSIQQPREAALTPPPATPPVTDSDTSQA